MSFGIVAAVGGGLLLGSVMSGGGSSSGGASVQMSQAMENAQIKSMDYQDQATQQVMRYNDEMAPIQRDALSFGLSSAKTAYGQAQDDRTYALGRRNLQTGLQDTMVSDARSFNQVGRQEQMAREASADVTTAFGAAQAQQQRGLSRMGVNPSSGRALAMANQSSIAMAAAQSSAANKTRQAARQEGYALTDRANSAMAGYSTQASGNTGQGAGYGSSGVGMANSSLSGMNSGASAMAGIASGMGNTANSAMNAYSGQMNANTNAAGDGGAGMLVGLASAGATAY